MQRFFTFSQQLTPLVGFPKLLHSFLSLVNPASPLLLVYHCTYGVLAVAKTLCKISAVQGDPQPAAWASEAMSSCATNLYQVRPSLRSWSSRDGILKNFCYSAHIIIKYQRSDFTQASMGRSKIICRYPQTDFHPISAVCCKKAIASKRKAGS